MNRVRVSYKGHGCLIYEMDYLFPVFSLRNLFTAKCSDGVKKDVELIEKEQIGLTPYPRFYSSVWTSVRQNISLGDHTLSESLEDAYIMLDVVNECLRRVEELKHGVSGALMNIDKMRVATLTLVEGLVNTRAQPFLEKVNTLLDTRLKLQNSKPIEGKEQ